MGGRGSAIALAAILVSVGALALVPAASRATTFRVETYLTGLNWPTAIAFAPDGRIFYDERYTGDVRIIKNGTVLPTPFYSFPNVDGTGEHGLLGLALDPDFPATPWVYCYYTFNDVANGTMYNRIARIWADNDTGVFHEVILDRIPSGIIHVGGVIAFGPDGKLWAVVGESGIPARAQDLLSLAGKVLRMNPNGTVPPDNPYYGNASVNPYIYTYGHRNMFGLAFHNATGMPYVTENGPECNDEVNLLLAGRNYGWGPSETCSSPPPPPQNTNRDGPNPVLPMAWYTPTTAPVNAIVYDGPNFTAWQGDLIFAEFNTRSLRRLDLAPPNYDAVVSQEVLLTFPSNPVHWLLDVEVGPDGAIWVTAASTGTGTSTIYRLVDTTAPPPPPVPPVASFTATPARANPGQPIQFDASASYDPDGTIASYAWDFGDGATDTGGIRQHAYAAAGTYLVTLTVVDDGGNSNSTSRSVSVNAPPQASFSVSPAYLSSGTAATFDGTSSSDVDGTIGSYLWDFGDGATGTLSVMTHAYAATGTYTVALTVTDNELAMGTATRQVRVNAGPRASILAGATFGFIGVAITFDGRGSSDPDGAIASYDWSFGDGGTAMGAIVSHAYATKGPFTVTLTVADDLGATDRTTTGITIVNRAPTIEGSAPTADFLELNASVARTLAVTARDPDGDPLVFAWRLDGAAVGSDDPFYEFQTDRPGTYLVWVAISDGSLQTSRAWTIKVLAAPAGPGPAPAIAWWWFGLPILSAIGVAALVYLLLARGRSREPPKDPPQS